MWFLFQAPCSANNFIEGFLEDAYGDGLKNKKDISKMDQWEGKKKIKCRVQLNHIRNWKCTTILFCKRRSSSWKKNLPQYVLVPKTQLAWEILAFTGGCTPGVQVAAVSWKHMVVFALFCEGLASVSQNNPIHCTTVDTADISWSKDLRYL